MASPAEIAQVLPDTLPADFSGWDSEDSPTARPVHSGGFEAARGMGVVPKLPGQPQAPQVTTEVAAATAPHELRKATATTPATIYDDDDGFFRQLKTVTSLVDKLPNVSAPMETAASKMDETRSSASLEAELMRTAGRSFSGLFESDSVEVEEPQPETHKMRNLILMGAAAAVLFGLFQVIHAGILGKGQHVAAPQPATITAESIANTSKRPKQSHATPGAQPAPTETQQTTEIRLSTADTYPTANPRAASAPARVSQPPVQSQMMHDQLTAPNVIPHNIKTAGLPDAPPSSGIDTANVEAMGGSGAMGSVFNPQARPIVKTGPAKPITISAGVAVGLLIKKTEPAYPPIAKTARVAGTVVLQATITKTGALTNLHAVSGPAMLRQAALEAVRTWHYRPYKLNNEPIEVDTTVNVIFTLGA